MEGLDILNEFSQETLIVLGVIGVILFIILAFLMFYTPYWIYKDANKREMVGFVWGLLTLFFLFFGILPGLIFLIIYLFVRGSPDTEKTTQRDTLSEPVFGARRIAEETEDDETKEEEDDSPEEPDIDEAETIDDEWEDLEEDMWEEVEDN